MAIRKLIEFFSTFPKLPIYATDVRDRLVMSGVQDEIIMTPIDSDPDVLRGMYKQYIRRSAVYADPIFVSEIFYTQNQCIKWQNFVCVKELVHILDQPAVKTFKRRDVLALTDGVSKSLASLDLGVEDFKAKYDKLISYVALAILLPLQSRSELLEPYAIGRISAEQISDETQIPIKYIPMLMDPDWDDIHAMILQL